MNPTSKDAVTSLTAMGVHQIVEQQKKNQVVIQILEPEVIQTNRQEQKSLKYKYFFFIAKTLKGSLFQMARQSTRQFSEMKPLQPLKLQEIQHVQLLESLI